MKGLTPVTLKHIRTMLGLSQQGMAELLGVTLGSVHRWEKVGQPGSIWIEAYLLLRSALKLGIDPKKIVEMSNGSVGRLRFFRKLGNLVVESRPT